jgi:hypothetical protein
MTEYSQLVPLVTHDDTCTDLEANNLNLLPAFLVILKCLNYFADNSLSSCILFFTSLKSEMDALSIIINFRQLANPVRSGVAKQFVGV